MQAAAESAHSELANIQTPSQDSRFKRLPYTLAFSKARQVAFQAQGYQVSVILDLEGEVSSRHPPYLFNSESQRRFVSKESRELR